MDIDPQEIGRNYAPALAIVANAKDVLGQLERAARRRARRRSRPRGPTRRGAWSWRAPGSRRGRASGRTTWPRTGAPTPGRCGPSACSPTCRAALPDDGILLADVGVHHNWIVQEWPAYAPRTALQSWGFASMGFGVAGVLGAKLAAPDRAAVAVVGDGGFMLMPSVVATAVQNSLPAVWLVWNNRGFISIRDQQFGYFGAGRELATSFRDSTGAPYSADFAALARSMGADGITVEAPGELAGALDAALASGRPTVVDARVDPDVAPPAPASWDLPPLPHPEPTIGWHET